MSANKLEIEHLPDELSAQEELVQTRYDTVFDASADYWVIDGRKGFDVGSLLPLVSPELRSSLKNALKAVAQKYSTFTIQTIINALRHFQKSLFPQGEIASWSMRDLIRYNAILHKEFGHASYLVHLRTLLKVWHLGRNIGVDSELMDHFKAMQLKQHETGRAVRVQDPNKGPLTEAELHGLIEGLNDAAEKGFLTLDKYSLAYLHVATGRRPMQSAALKCVDLIATIDESAQEHPNGRPLHLLAIPRAKQHGHGFRQTRRAIELSPQNYALFSAQLASVQELFRGLLDEAGWSLQDADLKHLLESLPLYPWWGGIKKTLSAAAEMRSKGRHGDAITLIRSECEGKAWHRDETDHGASIKDICESIKVAGRDGQPIKVTPTRLRYTKGTGLAREGLPAHIVAWLLDHSSTRSANVYVDNLPEHASEINRALSQSVVLTNFAASFRGRMVGSESEAVGGENPSESRIAYRGQGAATCGHLKRCGLDGGIPRACYTCSHFQPWSDGPHQEFLHELLQERQEHVASLGQNHAVTRRCDILIAAVSHVVRLTVKYQQSNGSDQRGEAS